MCLIIDACVVGSIFNSDDIKHDEYKPVLDWVLFGSGKIIYGGSKYKKELSGLARYLGILSQLRKAGKVIELRDSCVDEKEKEVKGIEADSDFDDPHIVAIVLVSGCKIVCTRDTRSIRFLKDAKFYTREVKRPKLYTSKRNSKLLSKQYVANICK